MPVPPEHLEIGRCYLTETGQIRRPVRFLGDGRVQYEERSGLARRKQWTMDVQCVRFFAAVVEREVPCDWTPGADEG